MYKCEKCKKSSQPNEKLNRVVTKTREKQYVIKSTDFRGQTQKDEFGNEIKKVKYGREIAREIKVCSNCLGNVKVEDIQENKYPNSNYKGNNFDPDYYKKKYANQSK